MSAWGCSIIVSTNEKKLESGAPDSLRSHWKGDLRRPAGGSSVIKRRVVTQVAPGFRKRSLSQIRRTRNRHRGCCVRTPSEASSCSGSIDSFSRSAFGGDRHHTLTALRVRKMYFCRGGSHLETERVARCPTFS